MCAAFHTTFYRQRGGNFSHQEIFLSLDWHFSTKNTHLKHPAQTPRPSEVQNGLTQLSTIFPSIDLNYLIYPTPLFIFARSAVLAYTKTCTRSYYLLTDQHLYKSKNPA